MKINIDGVFFDKAEAKISVFDHGLLYGDGVFEGLRIYNGLIFKCEEHLDRLYDSAKAILLNIPLDKARMKAEVLRTVAENRKTDGYIRLLVTRGVGTLGLDPDKCAIASVIIIVDDIQLYPEEYYASGIRVVTAASRRSPADCLDPRIKSLNYLNNILANIEARQAGCVEAVMLNKEGYVAECTADNIFIVTAGALHTPPTCLGALDGITRNTVCELAGQLGVPVRETQMTRFDLYTADECFLSGTGAEIVPVVSIDGRVIDEGLPGKITNALAKAFDEYIRGN